MPELPEVETVCRALEPIIVGKTIKNVTTSGKRLRNEINQTKLKRALNGARILCVRRRAKYIIIDIAKAKSRIPACILVHLGMSGSFISCPPSQKAGKHEHVTLTLSSGVSVRYIDPRRFGTYAVHKLEAKGAMPAALDHLGPEPLTKEFSGKTIFDASRKRKIPIKVLIMEQKIVVGVGNIYASEACFSAGVRPTKLSSKVTKKECDLLAKHIKRILKDSIKRGGASVKTYTSVDGSEGKFQLSLNVYGREGEPCKKCKAIIKQTILGQRSSFYCPSCQK